MITDWVTTRPWGVPAGSDVTLIGAFRFDDPDGQVGMETHLVRAGDVVLQVPLTYRGAPLDGAEAGLLGTMEHSALGTRWVYDGLYDSPYVTMLAAVTMTGQGEALGLVELDGRWVIAPAAVRISGGGWGQERVPVDGFELVSDAVDAVLRNDRFELVVHHRPVAAERPPIGLVATWDGLAEPVLLSELRER